MNEFIDVKRKRVVVVGGGFGGLTVAKQLRNQHFDVVLIDRSNHHLFQPLLYQVASSALSPGDIASPLRTILRNAKNITIEMDEVVSINVEQQFISLADQGEMRYDYLVLAPGSRHSYFGNNHWEEFAPGLKSLDDALAIREKMLLAFENAEHVFTNKELVKKYLTFVVVGAGPTGVEIAGAFAEIAVNTILPDYPLLQKTDITVILIEGGTRVLSSFSEDLSESAKKSLESLGVNVLLNTKVTNITENGVHITNEKSEPDFLETTNVFWGAGNKVSPLLEQLDSPIDSMGRVIVNEDLSIKNHSNVFVIGDAAQIRYDNNSKIVPGIAPAAIQSGKYVASIILSEIHSRSPITNRKPFHYWDKGSMATIGRAKAIAQIGKLEFSGIFAWLLWAVIHIVYLIGFRNRFSVMAEWTWYYLTFKPGARLIIRSKVRSKKQQI